MIERIRNFVIIAHVDHGKSTLADRLLELTGTVEARKMRPQYLDRMELERERGITIKMQPVRMRYELKVNSEKLKVDDDKTFHSKLFTLNLIDTPGHADFAYEVSRALAAVEGAILLVDATQGVQAQTISSFHLARAEGLAVIPAVNKIDLSLARTDEVVGEVAMLIGCAPGDVFRISAKTGEGVAELLEAITRLIPRPEEGPANPARALIFDSQFDPYRGVIAHVRVKDGSFTRGQRVGTLATGYEADLADVGAFTPNLEPTGELHAGEIGYMATGAKEPDAIRVGDTITNRVPPEDVLSLPGYARPSHVVFASAYPENADDYPKLLDALGKIRLSDAALSFEPESSSALGRGFRLGFLGMLHMEIVAERLAREYGSRPVLTTPSVAYRALRHHAGQTEMVYAAARLPERHEIKTIEEPWVRLEVVLPQRFLGAVMELLALTRGVYEDRTNLGTERITIRYDTPLRDVIVDFADSLKRVTSGYGSFSYEPIGYRLADVSRLDILIAGEPEPALAQVVPAERARALGRAAVVRLKELVPRQLFAVSLQAVTGGRVIARETIPALKKDVTGYLYGGDRTRKMKLWAKQKRGKERLAVRGRVTIPPAVFLELLRTGSDQR